MFKTLSILIPVYNERDNILKILSKIESIELPFGILKQIVIVDDCSTDGTCDVLKTIEDKYVVLYHEKNKGKGAALRTGLPVVSGEYVIIQDADLEYDPEDYVLMLKKLVSENLKVLYGSRRLKFQNQYSHLSFLLGGIILSLLTNILYRQKITDEPTCYKLIESDLLRSLDLECERFEFCPEVTAKIARLGYKISEIGINYYPRSIEEGKKIKWFDGWEAITTLWRYRNWEKPTINK